MFDRWLIVVHIGNHEETKADNVKIQMNVVLTYLFAIHVVCFLGLVMSFFNKG